MRHLMTAALASVSMVALASTAAAQPLGTSSVAPSIGSQDEPSLGEIVVTARRRSESLQEVPITVNAVTADTLQKLNIQEFEDVQSVVPGLSLSNNGGEAPTAQLRGVSFNVFGAAPNSTVAMYYNDAPVQANYLFTSLFDIGQIEVLRGPQGTTRGVSAPSGSITLTTRKPDLSAFGGFIDVTGTDHEGRNAQGALNIPIVKDVLAVRVAALIDQNDAGGITSIHSALRPSEKTSAERVSVSFEPTDAFNANVSYQHLDRVLDQFSQLSGPGPISLGTPLGTAFSTVNPPISPDQRVTVSDGLGTTRTHLDIVTAQVDSRIFGQHLSYAGSYQHAKQQIQTAADLGNQLPGVEPYGFQSGNQEATTQEIRLASDPAPGRFFDYTVGALYSWTDTIAHISADESFFPGAFGAPGTFNPLALTTINSAYSLPLNVAYPSSAQETSIFGSVTFHLDEKTELSGGIRHIWSKIGASPTQVLIGPGRIAAVPAALVGGNCAVIPSLQPSLYPGFCDATISTINASGPAPSSPVESPNVYTVSLSHHFTRDVMAYFNTGTAFRPAYSTPISDPLLVSIPSLVDPLSNHPSERSVSYEVGIKTTFLDGRARLNADIYRQHFNNLTITNQGVNYVDIRGQTTSSVLTQSVDARVQGFEVDAALLVTSEWNISLQGSYSDGKVESGALVACNTFDAAGNPTFNTGGFISLCPGGSTSRLPLWNLALTSEYDHPISDKVTGFIRGIWTYYPQNKRIEPNFAADAYGLLNLYAGLRSPDGGWEATVFAKNILANNTVLDRSSSQIALNSIGAFVGVFPSTSGYYGTDMTPEREVGLNLRYAWGSR